MIFLKDFILSFVVIGAGFMLPFLLLVYWANVRVEIALGVGWLCCSLLTAWLMGAGDGGSDV